MTREQRIQAMLPPPPKVPDKPKLPPLRQLEEQSLKLSDKPIKVYKVTGGKYERYMKAFTESLVAQNSLSQMQAQEVLNHLKDSSPSRHEQIVRDFKSKLPPELAK